MTVTVPDPVPVAALGVQIVIDCTDPSGLAEFWAEALAYEERKAAARARSTQLTSRGATLLSELDEPAGWCLVMADPEGNEFCLH